jgi:hypothetical protein
MLETGFPSLSLGKLSLNSRSALRRVLHIEAFFPSVGTGFVALRTLLCPSEASFVRVKVPLP